MGNSPQRAYTLKDTPSGELVGQAFVVLPAGGAPVFSRSISALQGLQAEATSRDALAFQGLPIGLIAVIGRQTVGEIPTLAESSCVCVRARVGQN